MTALIIGVSGQDGSYLAELLAGKGYEVHGIMRPSVRPHRMQPGVSHWAADVTNQDSLRRVMSLTAPDEIYNLAAQSHVGLSFEIPAYTMEVTGCGALNVFEAARDSCPEARIYQASSSEMFGNQPSPQSETTPFAPVSPYACAKVFAHSTAVSYRKAWGMHISCGILFNHESPRRGENFVTRKICKGLARIKAGLQDRLELGDLDARRDWGYAPEYVEAIWMMPQRETPGDYVIGTGQSSSVRDFLSEALRIAGLPPSVAISKQDLRPSEIGCLRADPRRAGAELGWRAKTFLPELVRIMMEAELKAVGL